MFFDLCSKLFTYKCYSCLNRDDIIAKHTNDPNEIWREIFFMKFLNLKIIHMSHMEMRSTCVRTKNRK